MHTLRTHGDARDEAQRHTAQQAAREQTTLDPRSVLIAIEVLINAGRIEEAKAKIAAWKAGQL